MTAPASYTRVLAALRRLSPSWPFTDSDTSVGKELGSIATAFGMAVDVVDSVLDELFPDTATTQSITRWEKVTRVPTRTGDDIATRRSRVLSVLRRASGPRLDQLAKMMSGPLDLAEEDILFIEQQRQYIDDALTFDSGALGISSSPFLYGHDLYYPGTIDSGGVRIKLDATFPMLATTITLVSPFGTRWQIEENSADWQWNREDFLGQTASGTWSLIGSGADITQLNSFQLIVSNDVDSSQIYNFFAYRDPTLSGTPDLVEAQRLFRRTALAHMNSKVIESTAFVVGDEHSLVGRDPVGGP